MSSGFAGIVVPGQARGAPADALNLVLWHWHDRLRLRHYAASINGRSTATPTVPQFACPA